MPADARALGRIHRVRTLQLTLARAEESRAQGAVATETALSGRIAQLAEAVAAKDHVRSSPARALVGDPNVT